MAVERPYDVTSILMIILASDPLQTTRNWNHECDYKVLVAGASGRLGVAAIEQPAHYIARANRQRLVISGMDKIIAFDQGELLDDMIQLPRENSEGTREANKVVTLRSNLGKKTL